MSNAINYLISGEEIQTLEIILKAQETIRAEPGAMLYMEDGIIIQNDTDTGVLSGFKRMVMGDRFFITSFKNGHALTDRKIAFAAAFPGKILALNLSDFDGEMCCTKDSFLCASSEISMEISFTKKVGSGIFGKQGFVLQTLCGEGIAFLNAGGFLIEKTLQSNEIIQIDLGCLIAMQPSVTYELQFLGGFKNSLFGGDGLNLLKLKGPGKVYLQSIPFSRLSDRIHTSIKVGDKAHELSNTEHRIT